MVTEKVIAIIPARGGSERLPRKNIVDFKGLPLIVWTIKAALETELFKRVLVSTDDEETALVTEANGVKVPFMRGKYADDHSPVSLAIIEVLGQLKERFNETYDTVVQLMPNCPLRSSEQIMDAYKNFRANSATFQISCFKFGWMNPWWAVRLGRDEIPRPLFPDIWGKRSQDLEELYCPTGAIWLAESEALLRAKTFYGPGHIFHPMDWKAAVDIDTRDDLEFAESLFDLQGKA